MWPIYTQPPTAILEDSTSRNSKKKLPPQDHLASPGTTRMAKGKLRMDFENGFEQIGYIRGS
jgi:hypothetical protein